MVNTNAIVSGLAGGQTALRASFPAAADAPMSKGAVRLRPEVVLTGASTVLTFPGSTGPGGHPV